MIIKRNSDDILRFLIKSKKKEYTLNELSQKLLIPKPFLSGMLTQLRCDRYIKYIKKGSFGYYSLINN